MPRVEASVELTFNHFGALADDVRDGADQIDRATAFNILADYQSNARRDTGGQANSAYVVTSEETTYGAAAAAARAANPAIELLPEVTAEDGETLVAVGAAYAPHNEYGVHGRAGDGAFTRAAERQRAAHIAALAQLIERGTL